MTNKLEKFEEIVKLLDKDVPSTSEVAELVATIIQFVKEAKEHLEKQAVENKKDLNNFVNRATEQEVIKVMEALDALEKKAEKVIKSVDEKTKLDVDAITKSLYVELEKLKTLIPKEANFTEVYGKIKEVEDKIPTIPDEITGEKIVEKINALPIEPEFQIEKEHIKGLVEELARIASLPRGGGGGVSAMGVRHAFKYIFHTEEPTGAINGSNTTYTVLNDIWAIIGFTLNGEQIAELPNYTFANKTITFATALPAAYSGKDFEIKYIG